VSYLKIHHTPNEKGQPQYEVIIDDGDPIVPERRKGYNDTTHVITAVAEYLADCEGRQIVKEIPPLEPITRRCILPKQP